ncbi:MAG: hypothetical protein ACT4P2_17285 [Pseudomonadota bacterium]
MTQLTIQKNRANCSTPVKWMCRSIHALEGFVPTIRASEFLEELLNIPGVDRQAVADRFWKGECDAAARGGYPQEDPFSESNSLIVLFLGRRRQLPYYESATRTASLQALVQQLTITVDTEEPLEIGIGEVGDLPWETILALRRSKFIDSFRRFMFTRTGDQRILKEEILAGLWSVVGQVVPSPTGSWLKRVGGCIPTGPIPNPYGAYREVAGGLKEWQLYKKYGWLFFLQEAREAVSKSGND